MFDNGCICDLRDVRGMVIGWILCAIRNQHLGSNWGRKEMYGRSASVGVKNRKQRKTHSPKEDCDGTKGENGLKEPPFAPEGLGEGKADM